MLVLPRSSLTKFSRCSPARGNRVPHPILWKMKSLPARTEISHLYRYHPSGFKNIPPSKNAPPPSTTYSVPSQESHRERQQSFLCFPPYLGNLQWRPPQCGCPGCSWFPVTWSSRETGPSTVAAAKVYVGRGTRRPARCPHEGQKSLGKKTTF